MCTTTGFPAKITRIKCARSFQKSTKPLARSAGSIPAGVTYCMECLRNTPEFRYSKCSNQLSVEELFIGTDATTFLLNQLCFCKHFLVNVGSFTQKILFENINFKTSLLKTLKLLDPTECQNIILLIVLIIHEIPMVLPICFSS